MIDSCVASSHDAVSDAPAPPRIRKGAVPMDNRAYEKSSRDEKLWVAVIGLLFALGLVWIVSG